MTPSNFSQKLKLWRGLLTRNQAAAILGVRPKTLQNWEQGRHMPRGIGLAAVLREIEGKQNAGT